MKSIKATGAPGGSSLPYTLLRSSAVPAASGTIAPFARPGSYAWKLIVETTGKVPPAGQSEKNPCVEGFRTAALRETAAASTGMPQFSFTLINRYGPAGCFGGPLYGPMAVKLEFRVSAMRHGVTAKYWNGPPVTCAVAGRATDRMIPSRTTYPRERFFASARRRDMTVPPWSRSNSLSIGRAAQAGESTRFHLAGPPEPNVLPSSVSVEATTGVGDRPFL